MTSSRSHSRKWWAPAAIGAIAAAMIAVVIFSDGTPGDSPQATAPETVVDTEPNAAAGAAEPQEPTRVNVERRLEADPLAVGAVDAPVALVMYSDFQCGFCAQWAAQTLPTMLEYVDAGDLRIEWRDIAIFGDASLRGALAAYAAGEQGEYLAFSQALYSTGSAPSPAMLTEGGLEGIAQELGLDVERFNNDRASERVAAQVQKNIDEAQSLGAISTPSFLLNGRPIVGAQPTEVFVQALSEELAQTS